MSTSTSMPDAATSSTEDAASVAPQASSAAPQDSSAAPQASSAAPQASSAAPQDSSAAPQASSAAPQASSAAPQATSATPQASSPAPQASSGAAQPTATGATPAATSAAPVPYACPDRTMEKPSNDTVPTTIADCVCDAGFYTETEGANCDGDCPSMAGVNYTFNKDTSANVTGSAPQDCLVDYTNETIPYYFVNASSMLELCVPTNKYCAGSKVTSPNVCVDDCSTCVEGHANNNDDVCTECAVGYYGLSGVDCTPCPTRSTAISNIVGNGVISVRCTPNIGYGFAPDGVLKCLEGYYGYTECNLCPDGFEKKTGIVSPEFGSVLERCFEPYAATAVSVSVSATLSVAAAGVAALV